MDIAKLVESFLTSGRYLRGWSSQTVRTYTHVLAGVRLEQISKQSLHDYTLSQHARGLTAGGINLRLRTVNSFLTWLHVEGHTAERFRARLLRTPKKVIPILADAEVKRLVGFEGRNLFLLTWGTADDVVDPATQSEPFLIALKQADIQARTAIIPGAPHFWVGGAGSAPYQDRSCVSSKRGSRRRSSAPDALQPPDHRERFIRRAPS